MDPSRFDALTRHIAAGSRRALLGWLGTLAAGSVLQMGTRAATAKRTKPCPHCQRRKKGKCRPLPDGRSCGACQTCQRGRCKPLCAEADCASDGGGFVCLQTCDPPCDLCSRCDRLTGQCEALCASADCTTQGCRVECDPICGGCDVCDFGECYAPCETNQCVNGQCQIACSPNCAPDEDCVGGRCIPVCDPSCSANEACVAGPQANQCVPFAGDCPAEAEACFNENAIRCTANNRAGRCVKTLTGASYCAQGASCVACVTDVDCQNQGFGRNSRCIVECEACYRNGGAACVTFPET